MQELLEPIQDLLGGGTLTLWVIVGGFVALYVAIKILKGAVKLAVLGAVALTYLGMAPWSGTVDELKDSAAAECAQDVAADALTGWQAIIGKRVTVENLSSTASCAADGEGLTSGEATATLRTFFDIPIATFNVDASGAAETETE